MSSGSAAHPPVPTPEPPATYDEALTRQREQRPGKIFLRADAEAGPMTEVSYAEIDERSRAVAAGLQRLGLQPGDRVAIAAPNSVEWLTFFFGAVRAGYVVVTLNVRYREAELDYMLNQSQAKLVLTAADGGGFDFVDFYQQFAARIPTVQHVYFLGGGPEGSRFADVLAAPQDAQPVDVTPSTPAVILYTSGTTGRPKGATLTHGSLIASAYAQAKHTGYTDDDRTISLMPLNHVGGLTCATTTVLISGATLTMLPVFSPEGALAALDSYQATRFGGVPTMWRLMLDHPNFGQYDVSRVREAVIGGSNAEPTLCSDIVEGFSGAKLVNLYGLSESSGAAVMSAPDDSSEEVSRYIGVALDGIESRVRGFDGEICAPGEVGELQLRGPSIAAGYWEIPEESAATFGDDGWLSTGDVVEMTEDGHIALRGRSKEMFVQGGYNVYPVEVENLLTSHRAVAMAAGIGVPDRVLGEVGRYFIVTAPGAEVRADELIELAKTKLASYKVPREIVFVDELPMTPAGKIAKAQLKVREGEGA